MSSPTAGSEMSALAIGQLDPSARPKPERRAHRVATACALFAVNAFLLGALSWGGAADAEPKASPEVSAQGAGPGAETSPAAAAPSGKVVPSSKENAPAPKAKPRARKYMPVRDFGGY